MLALILALQGCAIVKVEYATDCLVHNYRWATISWYTRIECYTAPYEEPY